MKNIIDYVETELHTMDEKKFNPVDSLILCEVANFEFGNLIGSTKDLKPYITFKDLLKAEYFHEMLDYLIYPKLNKSLLFALSSSPRFRNIKLNFFEKKSDIELQKQFAAVTFILDSKTAYIAFRGTDDSIIGWKEDFNMAFTSPVPSQIEGAQYVNKISKLIPHNFYIGGHSKGGNIAVYSALKCNFYLSNRILQVFSHDGPGFRKEVIISDDFKNIKNKINKTIPHYAIVGMLLECHEDYKVVKSSGIAFLQHNPFNWDVSNYDFSYEEDISSTSKYFNKSLNDWLNNISDEKRKIFIDALYDIIVSTNANGFSEITSNWKVNLPIIFDSVKNLDNETKAVIVHLIKDLKNISLKNLYPVEYINNLKLPNKPIVVNKFNLKKLNNKKNYCTVHIKK